MAIMNDLCERLRAADLVAEIESASPLLILGGEGVRDVGGIKVYKRGFSICYDGAIWLVKLPCGQTIDEYTLADEEEVFKLVINHFRSIDDLLK